MQKYENLYIYIEPEVFRIKPHLIIKKFSSPGEEVIIKDIFGEYAELGKILLDFCNSSLEEDRRTVEISDEEYKKYLEGIYGTGEIDKYFEMCFQLLSHAGWYLESGYGKDFAKTGYFKRPIEGK
jgi:hypothetical protein